MIIRQSLMLGALALLMCAGVGCGASREIEVKGEVTSAAPEVQGLIAVQFFDVVDTAKPELVHTISLDGLKSFEAKPALVGKEVLVRAINDRNVDGACSEGEPWAEVRVSIKDDDTVGPVSLALTASDCPAK